MDKIYGMAEKVCVWLGKEENESEKAIELIKSLVELKDFENSTGLSSANDLGALIKLLKRGWFSRRWVVQVKPLSFNVFFTTGITNEK
jgi:Heterokaryon incompatibility protein (HET)